MTSHITVSASQAGNAASGFSTPSSNSDDQSSGGFGALLDAIGSFGKSIVDGTAQTTASATPHPGFVHLDSAGATTSAPDAAASADALAKLQDTTANTSVSAPLAATAAADATAGATDTTSGTPPKLLRELVDSLAELQKAQQDGTPVDLDLLKRVKKAIDAISNFLTTQQPIQAAATDPTSGTDASSPTTAATSASGATTPATAASAAADAAKATLAALTSKLEALSSTVSQSAPDISAKLDQLAKSLDPAKLSSDTLSQLDLDATGSSADPKLAAAINGLVNGKAEATTALPQPALATPALKLPEGTTLSDGHGGTSSTDGTKATQSASSAAAATPTAAASQGGNGDASTDLSKKDSQSASLATNAAAAASKAKNVADAPALSTSNTAAPPATPLVTTAQAQTAYVPATAAAVALSQVPVEIVRHIQQGDSHFQIKLDPADLGRIDVKLAFDSSGAVSARVTAERPETLALLQRDAGSLNQALTQAGLDGSKTNLQFSLSQNPFARQDGNGSSGNNSSQPQIAGDDDSADTIAPASVAVLYRGTASSSGLNIVV